MQSTNLDLNLAVLGLITAHGSSEIHAGEEKNLTAFPKVVISKL